MSSLPSLILLVAAAVTPAAPALVALPPPPPSLTTSPFRLGLTYTRVLAEDGDLVNDSLSTNAIGIDLVSPSYSYARDHLGLAYQWERAGAYSARGFRVDLISFGYPITVIRKPTFHFDIEPILTVLRPELMFVSGGGRFLRLESAFGIDLSATWNHWFLNVQPFEAEFRYWVWASFEPKSSTGLGRIFPLRVAVGHEF